jgi:lia operon protein LiaF
MNNRNQLFVGGFIILFGVLFLLDEFVTINIWSLLWPISIISLGVWLLVRPDNDSGISKIDPFANVREYGHWQVGNDDYSMFIGDIHLDMTHADIPSGDTHLQFNGFIGDIKLLLPEDAAYRVQANGFISDVNADEFKRDGFLTPVEFTSPGYDTADKRVNIQTNFFIVDLDVYTLFIQESNDDTFIS